MTAPSSLLPVPAPMDATWLVVVGPLVVVVLRVEEPLPHNVGLLVGPLDFLIPVVLRCVAMSIQKPYIELFKYEFCQLFYIKESYLLSG